MAALDRSDLAVGYHGTDRCSVESILRDGLVASQGDDHWLGPGVYVFDDVSLTQEYAQDRYGISGTVIEVLYSLERQLDLTRYDVRLALSMYGQKWIEQAPEGRVESMVQDAGRRQLDHAVLEDVVAISNYASVRAMFGTDGQAFHPRIFPPNRPLWQAKGKRSGLNLHDHVQVAIVNPRIILRVREHL